MEQQNVLVPSSQSLITSVLSFITTDDSVGARTLLKPIGRSAVNAFMKTRVHELILKTKIVQYR